MPNLALEVVEGGMEPYRRAVGDILSALDTDTQSGLSAGEARERLERCGRNELAARKQLLTWRKFLSQFTDVLVLLLLVAALVSALLWVFERESPLPYEAMAIFAIVILNAVMGYVQEARAEQAVASLRQMSAAHAKVVRDGARKSIPATELVPGDIILIEEGDTVPADARIIQSTALQTAEAALTGESLPVSKDVAPIAEEKGLGDRHNMIFSGTAATYGRGFAVVTAWHANPDGSDRQDTSGSAARNHAATEGARPSCQAARAHRHSHRGSDDSDDHHRRKRKGLLGTL